VSIIPLLIIELAVIVVVVGKVDVGKLELNEVVPDTFKLPDTVTFLSKIALAFAVPSVISLLLNAPKMVVDLKRLYV
jgi:hypothetical protein